MEAGGWGLGAGDWELGVGDWGLGMGACALSQATISLSPMGCFAEMRNVIRGEGSRVRGKPLEAEPILWHLRRSTFDSATIETQVMTPC